MNKLKKLIIKWDQNKSFVSENIYHKFKMSHEGNNDPDDPIWIMVCEDHPNLTHQERKRIYEDLKGD